MARTLVGSPRRQLAGPGLCVEELEHRDIPSICNPTGTVLEALTQCRNWVTYAPSRPYDPTTFDGLGSFPNKKQIQADLKRLYKEGWRGLVTYSMDGRTEPGSPNDSLEVIPKVAKKVGFKYVIAGLYWYDDAQLAREKNAALRQVQFIDAFVVGNEGLDPDVNPNHQARYTMEKLEQEIQSLRAVTGRPVTTTEIGKQYLDLPENQFDEFLLDVGDWIFPNIQPFRVVPTLDVQSAVQHTVNEITAIQARRPDDVLVLKESWWPTGGGDPRATSANQVQYFGELATEPVFFVWGEAFDQFWKTQEGAQGPHWGFHEDNRTPKEIIGSLAATYTSPYGTVNSRNDTLGLVRTDTDLADTLVMGGRIALTSGDKDGSAGLCKANRQREWAKDAHPMCLHAKDRPSGGLSPEYSATTLHLQLFDAALSGQNAVISSFVVAEQTIRVIGGEQ